MNDPEDAPSEIFETITEDPLDHAAAELDGRARALAAAFCRAIPFLFRDGVAVTPDRAGAATRASLDDELAAPRHTTSLRIEPEGAPAALVLDATAVAFLLDGALGGDGSSPPALTPEGLTSPQRALLGRVLGGVVPAFSAVLEGGLGVKLKRREGEGEGSRDDRLIVLRFRLGEGGAGGVVALGLSQVALVGAAPGKKSDALDPALAAALGEAPLELVVELGRVRLTLPEVAALRVGDVLALATPVGSTVSVRIDEHVLFRGHPVTSGAHVAVRL